MHPRRRVAWVAWVGTSWPSRAKETEGIRFGLAQVIRPGREKRTRDPYTTPLSESNDHQTGGIELVDLLSTSVALWDLCVPVDIVVCWLLACLLGVGLAALSSYFESAAFRVVAAGPFQLFVSASISKANILPERQTCCLLSTSTLAIEPRTITSARLHIDLPSNQLCNPRILFSACALPSRPRVKSNGRDRPPPILSGRSSGFTSTLDHPRSSHPSPSFTSLVPGKPAEITRQDKPLDRLTVLLHIKRTRSVV